MFGKGLLINWIVGVISLNPIEDKMFSFEYLEPTQKRIIFFKLALLAYWVIFVFKALRIAGRNTIIFASLNVADVLNLLESNPSKLSECHGTISIKRGLYSDMLGMKDNTEFVCLVLGLMNLFKVPVQKLLVEDKLK